MRRSGSPGSRRRSTAILTARSPSSSGNPLGAAVTLILPWNESLHQTRYGTVDRSASDNRRAVNLGQRGRDVLTAAVKVAERDVW